MSSGWHITHRMSSGWLSRNWYLIRMSYDNVVMSSGWHRLPFVSHPDEIANFDFPHHAVALQRFRSILICCRYFTIIILPTYLVVLNFYNACQLHSVECLFKIRSVIWIIFHAIYGAVCIQLSLSLLMIVRIHVLYYHHHHQIRSMAHLPLFKVRSWNNGMRCMSLYFLISNVWWGNNQILLPVEVKLCV